MNYSHKLTLLRVQLTFVVGWGGGLTSAIVLARPLDLPINMFSNRHDIMIVAIWWLANYFPGGLPGKILRTKPMRVLSLLLTQICRAGTMCLVMSLVAKYHPDSTIGVIVMGAPLRPMRAIANPEPTSCSRGQGSQSASVRACGDRNW